MLNLLEINVISSGFALSMYELTGCCVMWQYSDSYPWEKQSEKAEGAQYEKIGCFTVA